MLAHTSRLACLKVILQHPSSTVGEVAGTLGIPINQASLFLRALQARGLICAKRQSRWVRYVPLPDPLVPEAAPVLNALRLDMLYIKRAEDEIKRTLTGFTHPRRLVILAVLHENSSLSVEALADATQISRPALSRHLAKLDSRGLARYEEQGWRLAPPPNPLAAALVQLVRCNAYEPQSKEESNETTL
jgi:DNA-binding transcriptional ArsR family regulator